MSTRQVLKNNLFQFESKRGTCSVRRIRVQLSFIRKERILKYREQILSTESSLIYTKYINENKICWKVTTIGLLEYCYEYVM